MDYTAHEVLSKEKDIPIRMDEIKKAVLRTHPDKKVTFDCNPSTLTVEGFYVLKYTIS
jgi:hypothetical protein